MTFFSRACPLNRKLFSFPLFKWAIIGDLTFYIEFDWPWPLTLTLDIDIDHSLFWKKKLEKRNVVTSRDAKRRLAYDKWNHLPMGISSRNNLQPTRNLYDFRFKSDGLLCDFHKSGDLDLNRYPIFQKFKMPGSYELHTSAAKRIRTIGPVLWPVHPSKTDKQTNKQTDESRSKSGTTFRNHYVFLQCDWPWLQHVKVKG